MRCVVVFSLRGSPSQGPEPPRVDNEQYIGNHRVLLEVPGKLQVTGRGKGPAESRYALILSSKRDFSQLV